MYWNVFPFLLQLNKSDRMALEYGISLGAMMIILALRSVCAWTVCILESALEPNVC